VIRQGGLSGLGYRPVVDEDSTILKAILFADLNQYSRLVADDEAGTLAYVERCFTVFRNQAHDHGGEFIKTTGDGVVVIFNSAAGAVRYAIAVQSALSGPGRFRVGIHVGEVQRRDGDIFGHAVNVAARLEAVARPAGICVSEEAYRAARPTVSCGFSFSGRVALKNIPEPVGIYHVEAQADARSSGDLLLSVIGGLSLSHHGHQTVLRSRTVRAVLGYLGLTRQREEKIDRLAALLWPGRRLADARRALVVCLREIDQIIGGKVSLHRGDIVALPPYIDVDLQQLVDRLNVGTIDDLVFEQADLLETLLAGLEGVSKPFDAWLSITRHNWRARVVDALEALLTRFGLRETMLRRAASALLVLDPTHEVAAQYLIRHHLASGNRPAALKVFNGLQTELRERFSAAPDATTIKMLEAPAEFSLGPTDHAAKVPVIAVGQFASPEGVPNTSALGFRADLITNMSRFREWAVVETAAGVDSSGADYLLKAIFQPSGENFQLNIVLTNPNNGHVVWSESFNSGAANWVAVQKEVVRRIAATLEVYLSHDRLSRNIRSQVNTNAYDAWLRGEALLSHWAREPEAEAMKLFEQVIAMDSNFAPAYAGLASIYTSRHFVNPGLYPDAQDLLRALSLARKAVELDPLDARSHLVLAWSHAMSGAFGQAELHFELVATLNPSSPKMLISAALGLAFVDRLDLAAPLLSQARNLTMVFLDYQWSHIATILYLIGDFEGAVTAAERSKNVIVDTPGWTAASLVELGRHQDARSMITELVKVVAAAWNGPQPCSPAAVLDWFVRAFPLRNSQIRIKLAQLKNLLETEQTSEHVISPE
jgi:class 3 adenylate cyclase/DNA-binding SARP family transcriptional activator